MTSGKSINASKCFYLKDPRLSSARRTSHPCGICNMKCEKLYLRWLDMVTLTTRQPTNIDLIQEKNVNSHNVARRLFHICNSKIEIDLERIRARSRARFSIKSRYANAKCIQRMKSIFSIVLRMIIIY